MSNVPPELKQHYNDQYWRLNNLYKIKGVDGVAIQFKMNWAQEDFYNNMHFFNVVLKARQLGFTTFFAIYELDACLFNSNHSGGIIAQDLITAIELFDNKIKFAYDNLPQWLKDKRKAVSDNARKLEFSNGSSLTVGTSLRGGTLQKLHVSEYGKIAAKTPDKAREIKTGAFNTVHAGQQIFVESTAEGQSGEFFELCKLAQRLLLEKTELTPLDPKFHFYSWYKNPDYKMNDHDTQLITVTDEYRKYFDGLRTEHSVILTPNQIAWYIKKAELMGDDMLREYPTTPEEAFAASTEGSIYGKQMTQVRKMGQITRVPWEPKHPVYTFWDLGNSDYTAIWFFQHVAREWRMIRYMQESNRDLEWWAKELLAMDYTYGTHYLPHDGNTKQLGLKNQSIKQMLEGLKIKPCKVVPRTANVMSDIKTHCRPALAKIWFDSVHCADGILCLDNYSKRWDKVNGIWHDEPRHDEASHGADAFRTFVLGYRPESIGVQVESFALGTANNSWMSG